jgi:iron complex transport system substrate-binding protein
MERLAGSEQQAVHIVDFDLFTQPSASTLVDGIELLAALFHPSIFEIPGHLNISASM